MKLQQLFYRLTWRTNRILAHLRVPHTARLAAKAVCCAFCVCFVMSMTSFDAQSREISDEVLRLHILANSDSEFDQSLKLEVRNMVQQVCYNIYGDADNVQAAKAIVSEHLDEIRQAAQSVVDEWGCDYEVKCEIVNMYFTTRVYDDITLPAGSYDAVRVTIGTGEGHNWWCVMFPPICIGTAGNDADISDVLTEEQTELVSQSPYSYKFKVYEWYRDLMELLDN